MAAFGFFAPNPINYANRVIIQPKSAPVVAPSVSGPIGSGTVSPNAPPPRGVPILTTAPTTTTTVIPFSGGVKTTTAPFSGGLAAPTTTTTTAPTSTGTTAPATGTDTSPAGGGGSGSDTSRLIDLIGQAFQPQDVQQPYGPQSVQSSGATVSDQTSTGTNPMAILVLAILAIAGIAYYVHRKGKRGRAA